MKLIDRKETILYGRGSGKTTYVLAKEISEFTGIPLEDVLEMLFYGDDDAHAEHDSEGTN